MKYYVGIPCLFGARHTQEAIESVIHHPDVHLLLIDNGAEQSVKDLISYYECLPNVSVIHNEVNIYVNPAWNQILEKFLKSDCDYVIIMNSDLILHKDWKTVLDDTFALLPSLLVAPIISSDKGILSQEYEPCGIMTEIFEGPPGVLVILNKEHVERIYPIHESIKVWFGDNWIYETLRLRRYHTWVLTNLLTYHSGSQNVSKVDGIAEIIEQDKIAWETIKPNFI